MTSCLATPSTDALDKLRNDNWLRACRRFDPALSRPAVQLGAGLPPDVLRRHRQLNLSRLSYDPASHDFYGSPASISLLDLLPSFMELSAAWSELHIDDYANITPQWMSLAGEWMLQAALEQYLVYGSSGDAARDEAFSWGCIADDADPDVDDRAVSALFCEEVDDGKGTEVQMWTQTRDRCLSEVRCITRFL